MKLIAFLSLLHIMIIALSNCLVQYPFTVFGLHTTWGAFSYPFIFIITDLTTRILGQQESRKVVFMSMFPGLAISYILSVFFINYDVSDLADIHILPMRVSMACFTAYVIGQLFDIKIFQRLRTKGAWWLAPSVSSVAGNIIDTFIFFSIAFYNCSDIFLSEHWQEIAVVDLVFKIIVSIALFIPAYGAILRVIVSYLRSREQARPI